ncbi:MULTISPECIES: ATP-binding cassette domain-containing protein [Streptomyces]|uniref:ATP-binding cassette subfamily B protein n=2 Tax=Streptomyces TaxID=1883 RepID=A0ABT9LN00_STRGD|nr:MULTISPECIES: ABC transporter ATP-binding protein [Streptomyces]MDP9684901.1 ATP-binding cassette subfamily B protein [Streptomyces griseoviridis]GGT17509.1 ABC transporter ATP-binding protein [Streptomyces griseoviridis]GHI33623.1 ABC transporter ATP-binding protein [Streptomyces daghestanicus]
MRSTGRARAAGDAADGPRPSRAAELFVLLCSVGAALAAVAQPLALGATLDLLLAGGAPARWLLLSAALLLGELLLDSLTALSTGRCTAGWTAAVRLRALAGLLGCVPDRARDLTPGDVGTRLTLNAADAGAGPAARAALAASLVTPVGALVALALVDVWVALCVLAGLPALGLVLRAFARDTGASVAAYQRVQSEVATRLLETMDGAATIAAAGTAARERARVLAPLPELAALGRRMWALHGRALGRSGVLVPLLVLAATGVGGLRLASGALSVGGLLAAARYTQLAAGVGGAASLLGALVRGRQARARTLALERLPALVHGTRELPPDGPGALELRGVRVVRDGREVLRADALRIPGGATVAVVGRGGAGKSVLVAVAGRLTDPDEGEVLLDGVPLGALSREALRAEVAFAFERPVLGEGTVAEAVAAGPRSLSPGQVRAALTAAGADGFVRRLPHGDGTPLAAAPLSGGEHQRLGLARAFAHAGRLLIMDDATSSLDTATEHEVDRALRGSPRPGTRLVVAHRPSVAGRADLVVWLEDGRVRAVGTHRELWRVPGYRAVFGGDGTPGTRGGAGADGHGSGGTPAFGAGNTGAPTLGSENTRAPVLDAENTGTPVLDAGNTGAPTLGSENTRAPVLDAENTGTPVLDAGNTGTPVHDTENTRTPVHDTENTGTPVSRSAAEGARP